VVLFDIHCDISFTIVTPIPSREILSRISSLIVESSVTLELMTVSKVGLVYWRQSFAVRPALP